MKKFRTLILLLGSSDGRKKELRFEIRQRPAAQAWAECLNLSRPSLIREDRRFYNFPNLKGASYLELVDELHSNIRLLSDLNPEIEIPNFDSSDPQGSVNFLHTNFAHIHLVSKKITPENLRAWENFNRILHAIESVIRKPKAEMPSARIVFTWNKTHYQNLSTEMLADFSVNLEFGTVYANYAQVGRHLWELYLSGDESISLEHIQPANRLSGDTNIWFGPTIGFEKEHLTLIEMEKWFLKNSSRFDKLGLKWGDSRLALGSLPVARLVDAPFNRKEAVAYFDQIADLSQVLDAWVE